MQSKVSEHYKKRAHELTSFLHDRGFLNPKLTLASIEWLDDYLGFLFESSDEIATKAATMLAKFRKDSEQVPTEE